MYVDKDYRHVCAGVFGIGSATLCKKQMYIYVFLRIYNLFHAYILCAPFIAYRNIIIKN